MVKIGQKMVKVVFECSPGICRTTRSIFMMYDGDPESYESMHTAESFGVREILISTPKKIKLAHRSTSIWCIILTWRNATHTAKRE